MKEKTTKNVHEAFVGEAKAYQRLQEYAKKAEEEGFPQIAHLFRAIAASEGVHSRRHFRLLESISDTQSNMEQAFRQENAVNGVYYPKMLQDAEDEGEKAAALIFSQARDVEGVHIKLYRKALENLTEDRFVDYYICGVCGYVHEGKPSDPCPVCNAAVDKFFVVE